MSVFNFEALADNDGLREWEELFLGPERKIPEQLIVQESYQNLSEIMGPDKFRQLKKSYLKATHNYMEDMQKALKLSDNNLLKHAAHSLKSSSAQIGALRLATFCARMETIAENANMDMAKAYFGELQTTCEATLHHIVTH